MSYFVEWIGVLIPPALVAFLLVPGLVLIAVMVALFVLAVGVVALAAAIVAAPYLLGSFLSGFWRALRADGRRWISRNAWSSWAAASRASRPH